jgi:hypothetical protein
MSRVVVERRASEQVKADRKPNRVLVVGARSEITSGLDPSVVVIVTGVIRR